MAISYKDIPEVSDEHLKLYISYKGREPEHLVGTIEDREAIRGKNYEGMFFVRGENRVLKHSYVNGNEPAILVYRDIVDGNYRNPEKIALSQIEKLSVLEETRQ